MSNSRKNFAYKLGKIPRLERSNGLHFSSAVVFDFWNVKKQIRVDTRFSNKFATTVFWLYSNEGNSNSCNKNHVTCRFYKGSCLFTYFLYYLCCVVGCKNIAYTLKYYVVLDQSSNPNIRNFKPLQTFKTCQVEIWNH